MNVVCIVKAVIQIFVALVKKDYKMEKIIEYASLEAAIFRDDVKGWVSRDGLFFGEGKEAEHLARNQGCTHVKCKECGELHPAHYTRCKKCRDKSELERFLSLPEIAWNGSDLLYSIALDKFFDSVEDVDDYIEPGKSYSDIRLVACEPVYMPELDDDFFSGIGNGDQFPEKINEAIDQFNSAVKGIRITWRPGKKRIKEKCHLEKNIPKLE
jgi:hypothetical protein